MLSFSKNLLGLPLLLFSIMVAKNPRLQIIVWNDALSTEVKNILLSFFVFSYYIP